MSAPLHMHDEAPRVTRADLLRAVWSIGDLSYLRDSNQQDMARTFRESGQRISVIEASRQTGKSWNAVSMALEDCMRIPGGDIRYAAPTQKMARNIVARHIARQLEDCPNEYKPRHMVQENRWVFPNGAELTLAGVDAGGAERLRGTATDRAYCDEAAFMAELEYVVQDILLPQTLTKDGRICLLSSSPKSPSHPFATRYVVEAASRGAHILRTVYDCPRLTPELIAEYMEQAGGEDSSTWQREYLCRKVADESFAVVPEWTRREEEDVVALERPARFDTYVSTDWGFNDLTVALFGYYDFMRAWLVIEDEAVFRNEAQSAIAPVLLQKERALWRTEGGTTAGTPGESWTGPRRRIADCTKQMLFDLASHHGWSAYAPEKMDAEAAINVLRMWVGAGRVKVHPRCRTLIAHLRGAIWTKSRRTMERSGEHGHFDAVDALKYMVRHVNQGRNPYEPHPHARRETHHIPVRPNPRANALRQMTTPRRRRR